MPPLREASRCGGGLVFVFAIATGHAALFLPAKAGRAKAETKSSMPMQQRRLRRGATVRSIQVELHRRAIALINGSLTVRTFLLVRLEMAARIAAPNRSAFPPQIASALLVFSFSFFLSESPLVLSGKFIKQKTHD